MSAPIEVEQHHPPAFACGAVPHVVVALWRRQPTRETIVRARSVITRLAVQAGSPWSYLAIVEPTSPPPPLPVIAEIETYLASHRELEAVVAAFEGRPAWLALGLDLAFSIAVPRSVRGTRRGKVCVDVDEGISWLTRRLDPDGAKERGAELRALATELRASLPPA